MPIKLTDREVIIAGGGNPDAEPVETKETPADAVAQVAAETPPEMAAERTPEGDGKPSESSETPSTEAVGGGKEAAEGKDALDSSWIDEDAKALGRSYGLEDDDLKAFATSDEFRRAAYIADKQLVASAAKTAEPPKAETPPAEKPAVPAEAKPGKPAKLDAERFKDYDEQTKSLVAHNNDLLAYAESVEAKLAALEPAVQQISARAAQEQRVQSVNHFHDLVDGMDAARYGKSVNDDGDPQPLDAATEANRRKLYESVDMIARSIVERAKAAGQPPQLPPLSVLVKRAENFAFAKEIQEADRKKLHASIEEQSKKRRGVAATRPAVAPPTIRRGTPINEQAKLIANSPELVKIWNAAHEESGQEA